jgi:transcriptional regulator with XRE-family HTH domain
MTVERLSTQGTRRGERALQLLADEFREMRLSIGVPQRQVATAVRVSRSVCTRIEAGRAGQLSIVMAARIAAVLGLDLSIRVFPGPEPVRGGAHAKRLHAVLAYVAAPLSYGGRSSIAQRSGQPTEQRAWDAVITGRDKRTSIELEMQVRDGQALERRMALKLRDDPVDGFLVLLADTRRNRQTLADHPELFPQLPRLTLSVIIKALRAGKHPPSGITLV